jgi:hypothetical protein
MTTSIEVLGSGKGRQCTVVRTERVGSGNHSNVGRARQATEPLASQIGVVVTFETCVREVRGVRLLTKLPAIQPAVSHDVTASFQFLFSIYTDPLVQFNNLTLWNGEELHNVHISPIIIRIIKSRRMRWAEHVARMGGREQHIRYWWESQKERDH